MPTITLQHPSTLSAADVLNVINSVVDADAPVVVQAIPGAATSKVSAYVELGEFGLGIITSIVNAISAAHKAKVASTA